MLRTRPSLRILLVDDHLLMRKLVAEQLRGMDLPDIDAAVNGEEGLARMESAHASGRPFDIVMIDRGMPVMNGMEMLRRAREIRAYDRTALVMLSGERDQESILEALSAGATSYIVKPISKEMLESKIARILDWLETRGDAPEARQHV